MSNVVHIELDRKNRVYRTGEVISGTIVVDGRVGQRARRIVLRTWWATEGKGTSTRGGKAAAILHEGAPPQGPIHRHAFHFIAPDAPFTYVGHHLAIDHHLQAVIELPMAPDLKVEETFVLTPGDDVVPAPQELLVGGSTSSGEQKARPSTGLGAILMVFGFVTLPFPGILFLAAGLVLVGRGLRTNVALSRIGNASVEVEPRVVAPGEEVRVRVLMLPPKPVQIEGVTASLRAREICESGGGNNRKRHRHLGHDEARTLLSSTVVPGELQRELTASFVVPALGMWSFKAPRNEIRWDIEVVIRIPSWPDWKQTVPLVVWPGKVAVGAGDRVALPAPERVALPAPETPSIPAADRVTRARPRPPTPVTLAGTAAPAAKTPEVPVAAPPPEPPVARPAQPVPPVHPRRPAAAPRFDLPAAIETILATRRYSPGRDEQISNLIGQLVEAVVLIDRIDRPFGRTRTPGFEDGRIVRGRLRDSGLEVEVHVPTERVDLVEGLGRTDPFPVSGSVASWQRLPERPVIRVSGHDSDAQQRGSALGA